MYESFFGFTQRPFVALPRTELYYPSEAIESARLNLTRCIERAEGCGLLVGPVGTGKTLLCHVLAEHFQDRLSPVLLSNISFSTRKELLQAILFELGLPYRRMEEGELRLSLIDRLAPREKCPDGMLLLVDEAHSLSPRLFDELRMLTNLVRGGSQRVRLVMAGSGVLEERFAHPRMESFNQRLVARCYLESFSAAESTEYVRAQTAVAGVDPDLIWSDGALRAIYHATDGCPRLINQVCDHALILAGTAKMEAVSAQTVEEAWADLQQLPMPWNGDPVSPADGETTGQAAVIEFGRLDDDGDAEEVGSTETATGRHVEYVADTFESTSRTLEPEPATFEPESETFEPEAETFDPDVSSEVVGDISDYEPEAVPENVNQWPGEQKVIDFQSDAMSAPETQLDHIEFHLADAQNTFDEGAETTHVELVFNDDVPVQDELQEQVVIDDFDGLSCDYAVHLSPAAMPVFGDDSDIQGTESAVHPSDPPRSDWQTALDRDAAHADLVMDTNDDDSLLETESVEGQLDADFYDSNTTFEIGSLPYEMPSHIALQSADAEDEVELSWRHLSPNSVSRSFHDEQSAQEDAGDGDAALESASDDRLAQEEANEGQPTGRDYAEAEQAAAERDAAEQDAAENDVTEDVNTQSAAPEPVVTQHPTIPVRQREYRRLFEMLYDGSLQTSENAQ